MGDSSEADLSLDAITPDMNVNSAGQGKLRTPLASAASSGNAAATTKLLECKAEVDAACTGGTALAFAADAGHLDCAKVLVENGADVNSSTKVVSSLLQHTYGDKYYVINSPSMDKLDMTKFLIDAKANMSVVGSAGHTLAYFPVQGNSKENLQAFIEAKADLNKQTTKELVGCIKGFTPLAMVAWCMYACPGGIQDNLLGAKADPHKVGEPFKLTLTSHCSTCQNDVYNLNLMHTEHKCEIHKPGKFGLNLIHVTCFMDAFEVCRYLLTQRVNVKQKFLGMLTCVDLATKMKREELAELMMSQA